MHALDRMHTLVPLGDAERAAWTAVARVQRLPARARIGRAGETCTRITFVNSGLLRVYFLADGAERTCRFLTEGSWYTDFESLMTGAPSRERVQAIEPSEVVHVEKADLERLYQGFPSLERAGRLLTEEALRAIHLRNQMLTLETPADRYERICAEDPALVNRVPQYLLASYLHLRPESLSRIRRRRS